MDAHPVFLTPRQNELLVVSRKILLGDSSLTEMRQEHADIEAWIAEDGGLPAAAWAAHLSTVSAERVLCSHHNEEVDAWIFAMLQQACGESCPA